jgi:SagB-type dehydrogenase family enzyme
MSDATTFRDGQPLAWLYHRNTCRWLFNTLDTGDDIHPPEPAKEHPSAPATALPTPAAGRLGALLERRASCRDFADTSLTLAQLSSVLHAAYGVLDVSALGALEFLERPVPSGGGLYPLELYVIANRVEGVAPGIHHFAPAVRLLEQLRDGPIPADLLTYLFMGQSYVARAAAVVATTAVWTRSLRKYGDRGYRYVLFEAGHVAQNVDLAAAEAGLGALNLGGFFDDELAGLLTLDPEHEMPLYATALGVPTGTTKHDQRAIAFPDSTTGVESSGAAR